MARPKARVIADREFMDGKRWEILAAEYTYIITYRNEPVNIRIVDVMTTAVKYKKLSYTNIGNAIGQVKYLNHKFATEDFSLIKVGSTDEI